MTQYERMVKGLIYDPADPEIMAEQGSLQEPQSHSEYWMNKQPDS